MRLNRQNTGIGAFFAPNAVYFANRGPAAWLRSGSVCSTRKAGGAVGTVPPGAADETSEEIRVCPCPLPSKAAPVLCSACVGMALFLPQARPVICGVTVSALPPFYFAPTAPPFVQFRLFLTTERRRCSAFSVNSNKNMETGWDLLGRKNRSVNYLYRETFFQIELSFEYQK